MNEEVKAEMETILIVEDEPAERTMLQEVLRDDGYELLTASNGFEAKSILAETLQDIKAILLDWMMPGMTGIELLHWLKSQPAFNDIEVILQSGRMTPEDVKKGIEGGAYYYLTKPYQVPQLRAVVRAAISNCELKRSLLTKIQQNEDAFRLLTRGNFKLQTLTEAESLAVGIAATCETCQKGVGLFELLVNAVEHGNLGISYEEKSELLENGSYNREISRRLTLPENRKKWVEVELKRLDTCMEMTIEDDGPGFDFENYLRFDRNRLFDSHGRGILLASTLLRLEYIPPGNKVRVRIPLPQGSVD